MATRGKGRHARDATSGVTALPRVGITARRRHKLAAVVAYQFAKTGVAVCTDTLPSSRGQSARAVKSLSRRSKKWSVNQCVNNPSWLDASAGDVRSRKRGAWGKRNTAAHHPLVSLTEPSTLARIRVAGEGQDRPNAEVPGGFRHAEG